jgi:hypothetical protein
VKIEQTGPNFAGSQTLYFRSLEFFSDSEQGKSGIFRSLFAEHREEIQRFVCVTARDYEPGDVHSISPRTSPCTHRGSRSWMEIDFCDHQLLINSYRLKRHFNEPLREWSLLGSNDRTDDLDKWTCVDSREENSRGEFELFEIFQCFGGPFRYYRLVNECPNWYGTDALFFMHIDLFGVLFPVK